MTKARDIASAAPAPSTVSATEIGYFDGVSSAIQTQIDGKSSTSHNHDSTYVAKSLVDAKGDLLVGSANDTVSRLAVASTAGYVLTVDSAEATGLKWAAAAAGGKVLQVVQDTTTTLETTTSTSYIDTALSQAITPSAATSKVLVIAQINGYSYLGGGTDVAAKYNVVRTSTQLCEQFLGGKFSGLGSSVVMVYLDSPNTTSSTTYKVQMKKIDGDARILDNNLSSLTLIEIGA